ncbi:MAG: amidohydrolase, partial [Gammaproteobacteria bacterium]|nr:amidohydrolase [Gemmatimonadota bacterium]NIU76487.1 amidohydrolase [Gammaproteobacteria bacterium]
MLDGRTVVITDGRIQAVLGPGAGAPPARRVLDANGRLLTPGIVDVHGHLDYVLGDSVS